MNLAHLSGREKEFVEEAFETNWVVPLGPNVDGFESDLEEYSGDIPGGSAGTDRQRGGDV